MSSSSTSDVQYIPRKAKLKRSVVVDGQNILHSFTHTRSTKGNHLECIDVLPVLRYFLVRKFPVQVVVPRFFLSSKRNVVKNSFVMVELLKIGLLLASQYQHSDDLLAVKAAYVSGGAILSKDKFRDHVKMICKEVHEVCWRTIHPEFKAIEKWNPATPFLKDSNGDIFYQIKFSFEKLDDLYCLPEDSDYDVVKACLWSDAIFYDLLRKVDLLFKLAEVHLAIDSGRQVTDYFPGFFNGRIPRTLDIFKSLYEMKLQEDARNYPYQETAPATDGTSIKNSNASLTSVLYGREEPKTFCSNERNCVKSLEGLDEKKQEAWDRVVFACPSVDTDVLDMILLVQRDLSTNAVLEEYRKFVDFKRCWLQLRSDEQSIESISTSSLQSTVGTSLDAFNENARSQAKAALVNSLVQAGLDRAKLEVLLDKEQGNLDADRIVQIYFDHEYASISGSG